MTDNRFKDYPLDNRFPTPGSDTRFPAPGSDTRFPAPGQDDRFSAEAPVQFTVVGGAASFTFSGMIDNISLFMTGGVEQFVFGE